MEIKLYKIFFGVVYSNIFGLQRDRSDAPGSNLHKVSAFQRSSMGESGGMRGGEWRSALMLGACCCFCSAASILLTATSTIVTSDTAAASVTVLSLLLVCITLYDCWCAIVDRRKGERMNGEEHNQWRKGKALPKRGSKRRRKKINNRKTSKGRKDREKW